MRGDVSPQLAQLHLPLLYLRATHDHLVPAAAGALIARLHQGSQMIALDAPHFLLETRPGRIEQFIASLGRG